ncbi:MAG: nucleotidyl transferase AbiEii/AbiGii toxin family protein [Candidatus Micrarchaeales archaeon]
MNLQEREAIVLEVLGRMKDFHLVLVGGYAVNAYVPPRFSVDCDVVVMEGLKEVEKALMDSGFTKAKNRMPQGVKFMRYVREKEKVAFDLMIGEVSDRTVITFEKGVFEKYSSKRAVVGRASQERIEMRVADPELLFAMKFVAGRRQDVRDMFMLAGAEPDWMITKEIILKKCSETLIRERVKLIEETIRSDTYRKSLEGAFGGVPEDRFVACKDRLSKFLKEFEN